MTETLNAALRESPWRRAGNGAIRVLEVAAAALIMLMVVAILANVVSRAFGAPIAGTTELVAYLWLPAIACVGFVVAQARGQSIEADILYSRLPARIRREVRFLTSLVAALACVGFTWYGTVAAAHALRIGMTAPASGTALICGARSACRWTRRLSQRSEVSAASMIRTTSRPTRPSLIGRVSF